MKQIEEEKFKWSITKSIGITPQTIKKDIRNSIKATFDAEEKENIEVKKGETLEETIERLTEEMMAYARKYEFEKAATLRDFIEDLKNAK